MEVSAGYLGFHPPYPGQDEDVLSEQNVKSGFVLGPYVQVCRMLKHLSSIHPLPLTSQRSLV